jgi:hypothetical protein
VADRPRSKRKPYSAARYGAAHRALRARLAPVVAQGSTPCARCGEVIGPGEEWQLDHRDDGKGWLGPSHRRCNASAGWSAMVAANGSGALEEAPCVWPRRWHEQPAIGTAVFLGGGLVEVHVGGGTWSTVAADRAPVST